MVSVAERPVPPVAPDARGDACVVGQVLAGDIQAFEVLIRRYNQRLFRLARSIVGDDQRAFDVVQEAYVSAFTHLATFRGPDGFATWLHVIVRNQAFAMLREQKREASYETAVVEGMEHEVTELAPDPEEALSSARLGAMLQAAVDRLPPAFRVVFVLRAVEGLSVRETAEILDLNEKTVKTRYFRAKRLLRERCRRQLQSAGSHVYEFAGARCDALTARVMGRISGC